MDETLTALKITTDSIGSQTFSINIQLLAAMTFLTVLPGILLAMSAFTRVIIVLSILRQALGLSQTPNNQILIALSLFLTFFIMSPVFKTVNEISVQPYMEEKMSFKEAIEKSVTPIRAFMLSQTRESDLKLFHHLNDREDMSVISDPSEIPLLELIPAFVTSELKTAFQIGFMIFIPFLVIDLVVASILMAMGMMMLSPLMISLPFKLMLFVMIDGWALVLGTLASSFVR
jgi:flagellar biosynthetic protein FliP